MRRTERMLGEAIDNLSDSFSLYDSDQRVVLTNRRFHETLPFHPPQDEIVGRTMQELIEASVANGDIIDPRVGEDSARFVDAFIAEGLRNRAAVREATWTEGRRDTVQVQQKHAGAFVNRADWRRQGGERSSTRTQQGAQ